VLRGIFSILACGGGGEVPFRFRLSNIAGKKRKANEIDVMPKNKVYTVSPSFSKTLAIFSHYAILQMRAGIIQPGWWGWQMVNLFWLVAWHGAAVIGALAWIGAKAWARDGEQRVESHNLGMWTGLGAHNVWAISLGRGPDFVHVRVV
jgi:hypothetical protein